MVKRDIRDYLHDILEHIDFAQEYVQGMTFQDFQADNKTILAVTRALEVIGEATKQVPPSIRSQYPDVPWRDISGMRDQIAHAYFGLNLKIVWSTTQKNLPTFRPTIQSILEEIEGDEH